MIEHVFRDERDRVLATLISVLGDFDLAEDALQDALAAAVERWPRDGVPANPAGFLIKVDGIYMPLRPGKPGGQESVHPQEKGGPRENSEEEDRLAAKNRPEDISIPDG